MTHIERKRRTRDHIIADLSMNHVERFVLQCGYTAERVQHDYGIDLEITTFNRRGEIQPGQIWVKLKATDRLQSQRGEEGFTHRISRRDLVYWLAQPMPMILILYDAREEVAYWLYVQSYFQRADFNVFEAGATITLRIPRANVLDNAAVRKFARFRDRLLAQMTELAHDEN